MPFLRWLLNVDPSLSLSLAELQKDCTIYLLPDWEDEPDIRLAVEKFLEEYFQELFSHELSEWFLNEECYPELSYSNFLEWFTYSAHCLIYDLVPGRLTRQ